MSTGDRIRLIDRIDLAELLSDSVGHLTGLQGRHRYQRCGVVLDALETVCQVARIRRILTLGVALDQPGRSPGADRVEFTARSKWRRAGLRHFHDALVSMDDRGMRTWQFTLDDYLNGIERFLQERNLQLEASIRVARLRSQREPSHALYDHGDHKTLIAIWGGYRETTADEHGYAYLSHAAFRAKAWHGRVIEAERLRLRILQDLHTRERQALRTAGKDEAAMRAELKACRTPDQKLSIWSDRDADLARRAELGSRQEKAQALKRKLAAFDDAISSLPDLPARANLTEPFGE